MFESEYDAVAGVSTSTTKGGLWSPIASGLPSCSEISRMSWSSKRAIRRSWFPRVATSARVVRVLATPVRSHAREP